MSCPNTPDNQRNPICPTLSISLSVLTFLQQYTTPDSPYHTLQFTAATSTHIMSQSSSHLRHPSSVTCLIIPDNKQVIPRSCQSPASLIKPQSPSSWQAPSNFGRTQSIMEWAHKLRIQQIMSILLNFSQSIELNTCLGLLVMHGRLMSRIVLIRRWSVLVGQ